MRRTHSVTRFPAIIGGLAAVLAFGGCSKGPTQLTGPGAGSEPASRIRVNNSPAQLARRVHDTNGVKLQIESGPGVKALAGTRQSPLAARSGLTLSLIAEVDPPSLLGTTLQANHITMHSGKVYVAYNVQGPIFMGGVDVFDVSPAHGTPTLISSALYSDTDVNGVDSKDGRLFMATATGSSSDGTQAGLETMVLDRNLLTTDVVRMPLPSYAGTGVVAHGGYVFATSGDGADGGLAAFDAASLTPLWRRDFADARAVTMHGNTVLTMSGQPCTMRMYDGGTGAAGALPYCTPGGAMVPHSKGTVVVHQGLAFVAAGDGGARIVRLSDGVVTDVMPVPNPNGVSPDLAVTNAVAVSGNHVYIANGGAGLWVARLRHEQLEVLGSVAFSDGASVNFVAAHGNLLFVATGTGGLRVVRIHGGPSQL